VLIGYARVSTQEQSPRLQLDALQAAGCGRVFVEKASGAQRDRPELKAALGYMRDGAGDVLVVWKLDRLGRSLGFLVTLIEKLRRDGAGFRSLTDHIDTTTAGGTLVFHIMAALAQFERSLIAERTRDGMKAARRRGKAIGRPARLTPWQVDQARALLGAGTHTVPDVAELMGVGLSTVYRALRLTEEGRRRLRRYRRKV
jgi:DNA invertase Pin-like site-specific DNA recombinase